MTGPFRCGFTLRQIQVVKLVARQRSTPEIATTLGIKDRTARAHIDTIRMKLRARDRREIPEAFMRQTGIDPYPRLEDTSGGK